MFETSVRFFMVPSQTWQSYRDTCASFAGLESAESALPGPAGGASDLMIDTRYAYRFWLG